MPIFDDAAIPLIRETVRRVLRESQGGGPVAFPRQSINFSAFVGLVQAGGISARVGAAPGSGDVELYRIDAATGLLSAALDGNGLPVIAEVGNLGGYVAVSTFVLCEPDRFGALWTVGAFQGFFAGRVYSGGVTARSGATAGTGTVELYGLSGTTLATLSVTIAAKSLLGSAIPADTWCYVKTDDFGVWWIVPVGGGFNRVRFYLDADLATTDASKSATVSAVCNGSLAAASDTITVFNHPTSVGGTYIFSGTTGAYGTAIYDDTLAHWDVIQMECP